MFCYHFFQGLELKITDIAGPYSNYTRVCEPYYQIYNKSNLEKILFLKKNKNINTVWLNIKKEDFIGLKWFNGEKYGKVTSLQINILRAIVS